MLGYHPEVILADRRINDGMGKFIAEKTVKLMIRQGTNINGAKVAILGFTFKEDCPDLRNSRVPDIFHELESFGIRPIVFDPLTSPDEAHHEYGIDLGQREGIPQCDAIVLAVAHREFRAFSLSKLTEKLKPGAVIVDVKSCLDLSALNAQGFLTWRL